MYIIQRHYKVLIIKLYTVLLFHHWCLSFPYYETECNHPLSIDFSSKPSLISKNSSILCLSLLAGIQFSCQIWVEWEKKEKKNTVNSTDITDFFHRIQCCSCYQLTWRVKRNTWLLWVVYKHLCLIRPSLQWKPLFPSTLKGNRVLQGKQLIVL